MFGSDKDELRRLTTAVESLDKTIRRLLRLFEPHLIEVRLSVMPKTVQVGQTANAVIAGFDQFGKPFPLDATYQVAYSAATPADVSFSTPAADGSAVVTAVNVDPGDAIIAMITRPDGSTLQTNSDTLAITAAVPVLTTATLALQ